MITSLMDADIEEFNREQEADYKRMQLYQTYPKLYRIVSFLEETWCHIMFNTICRRGWNCNIQMDGWFGPDSGGEDWWCERCGRGGSHVYY